jgi:hypothetical protein
MEYKVQIVTVILTALSTLLVTFIGIYGNNRLEEIRNQSVAATQTRTIELEREKLKAEQQARLEKTLLEYIPKLVGANESERKTALAVLFILYPNDAKVILERTTASLSGEQKTMLQPTVQQAEALATKTGAWSIVIGSDATLEGAQFEATQARKQGYTPAVIYQKDKWFVTIWQCTDTQYSGSVEQTPSRCACRIRFARRPPSSAGLSRPCAPGAPPGCRPRRRAGPAGRREKAV